MELSVKGSFMVFGSILFFVFLIHTRLVWISDGEDGVTDMALALAFG
jgi:hypothetical protein